MDGDLDSLVRCTCHRVQAAAPAAGLPAAAATHGPLTYSLAEAAQRIGGVTERWLAIRLRDGQASGYKIGRQWRMTEFDIQDLIDKSRVIPRSEPPIEVVRAAKPSPQTANPPTHLVIGEQYALFS